MMATSFADKQQWVALLEAVTSSNKNSNKIADASVFGNVICRMSSRVDMRMDVMCTWPLSDNVSISIFSLLILFLFHYFTLHSLLYVFTAIVYVGHPNRHYFDCAYKMAAASQQQQLEQNR